jgi:hydroxymethylpyrimidine pyrophosphatase-like HAD family hydrolase
VFAYMVPTESIEDLRKMMNDFLLPFDDAKVSGNHDWSFMLHRSFSKAAVLLEIAAKLGIDRGNIVAVGDGLNDISMLNGSVTSKVGCPANASREVIAAVKKAGGIVSAKESAAGTLEIIEYYFGQ